MLYALHEPGSHRTRIKREPYLTEQLLSVIALPMLDYSMANLDDDA